MQFSISRFTLTLALASVGLVSLYGCGGGGGGSASSGSTTPVTLSVTSATGVAFVGAIITVTDRTGAVVGTSSTVGADGLSTITLSTGAVAPFVLTATRTSADGATETLVSVVPSATATTTVNITPITNLIASRLSPSGDPTKLASEVGAGTATVTTTTVASTVTDVQSILQPLITAVGAGASGDPLTGTFSTNGTGYDRLLDSVKVTIIPTSSTTTNVEIGVKQMQADGAQPVAVQFNNGTGQTAASSVTIPTITSGDLLPSGTSAKIAAHLAQLTNCFALASTTRVSGITAADISAPECQQAFFNNDAITYKSNGKVVSSTGAFSTLFSSGVQNVVFSQGNYEFTRSNGDIVVSYKSRTAAGNETFDTFALRLDTADDKLKQIGNQYDFSGGVSAYQQRRDFVTQAADSYYSTGYTLNVPLTSGIAYVRVTTPKSNIVTLIPGSDGMMFPKLNSARQPVDSTGAATTTIANMVPSGTNFIRVRSEYVDTASTAAHPSTRDTNLFFIAADDADAAISTYGNQSVWAFQYFNSAGVQQGTTQNYKTRIRARTIAEVRTQQWANLNAATITDFQSGWILNSSSVLFKPLSTTANLAPAWEVPTGALPPTGMTLFGSTRKWVSNAFVGTSPNFARTSFNDAQSVGSTARSATMICADGNGEIHCNTTPNTGYQSYASMSGLHLWARNPAGSEFARFYATYVLP